MKNDLDPLVDWMRSRGVVMYTGPWQSEDRSYMITVQLGPRPYNSAIELTEEEIAQQESERSAQRKARNKSTAFGHVRKPRLHGSDR
jgi:hypothetical protein